MAGAVYGLGLPWALSSNYRRSFLLAKIAENIRYPPWSRRSGRYLAGMVS